VVKADRQAVIIVIATADKPVGVVKAEIPGAQAARLLLMVPDQAGYSPPLQGKAAFPPQVRLPLSTAGAAADLQAANSADTIIIATAATGETSAAVVLILTADRTNREFLEHIHSPSGYDNTADGGSDCVRRGGLFSAACE
jgi:hypothetical protein